MPKKNLSALALTALLALIGPCVSAQDAGTPRMLPPVLVTEKANPDPVEKSYRRMVRGMDLFEREHRALAPDATLRFRLLPRKPDSAMDNIELYIFGSSVELPVPVAPDHSFVLPRDPKALDENAQVVPNRRAQTMTWRTEIRSPGVPPHTRRLGDLRLECRVGMEAGLVSNSSSFIGRIAQAMLDGPSYCEGPTPRYLFFAERPVFSVTLVDGPRRQVLAMDKLYAGASENPAMKDDLPYCDCEVLLDRAFELPLGDRSWPDHTLVEFEYMENAP